MPGADVVKQLRSINHEDAEVTHVILHAFMANLPPVGSFPFRLSL